ncbi:PE-PPE domain-containing protein [Mycolicibacterium duvalii]|uniref:PE-PPE domain-containing protein n=2 Tax=Mycolicibacterium duvalii TaxID=39688 RepID=A0A7I7K8N2_9MYCO|nr:PE-PPE domain-containing protein [Mycolicibacterium duvalii]PEG41924.1 PE-PPE domain-containing protein [Mycolicibacterium duvalii]BBX20550.1 hypothetical protein MDUV_54100 [Mycolicibacterium duvalii]
MRRSRRSPRVLAAVLLAALLTLATAFSAALGNAATALIMGGSSHPLSIPGDTPEYIQTYIAGTDSNYIAPSGLCGLPCSLVAVYTPEQIRFVTGLFDLPFDESVAIGQANLDDCARGVSCTVTLAPYTATVSQAVADDEYLVFAYSESATIASKQKLQLIAHPLDGTVSFLLLANPNRPNGGILERFVGAYVPFLGISFDGPTPTFSPSTKPMVTVDIARQYDGWTDFPTNPLNLLAVANAMFGTVLVHGDYYDVGTPQLQGLYQDTSYYLIPTPITPLLTPLTWVPLLGRTLAIAIDAPLRVLIETGYDRTVNPGKPTPARYLYIPDLFRAAIDFAAAIPTGWDDAISYLAGDPDLRPFHTEPATSPYGVGGPPVYAGAVDPYGDLPFDEVAPVEGRHDAARREVDEIPTTADAAPPATNSEATETDVPAGGRADPVRTDDDVDDAAAELPPTDVIDIDSGIDIDTDSGTDIGTDSGTADPDIDTADPEPATLTSSPDAESESEQSSPPASATTGPDPQ